MAEEDDGRKDRETRPEHERDDEDREAILARRRAFVVSALTGLAIGTTSSVVDAQFGPCLSVSRVVPYDAGAGTTAMDAATRTDAAADGATDAARDSARDASRDASRDANTRRSSSDRPRRDAGTPAPCLRVARPPIPAACLTPMRPHPCLSIVAPTACLSESIDKLSPDDADVDPNGDD